MLDAAGPVDLPTLAGQPFRPGFCADDAPVPMGRASSPTPGDPGDGLATPLTPAEIDRRIDERVVRARGEAEWITGSDFAEVVRHG